MKGRKKENKIRNENENWKGENKKLKWRLDCRYSIRHRDVIVCQKLLFARSYSVANQFISNTSLATYSTQNILLAAMYL